MASVIDLIARDHEELDRGVRSAAEAGDAERDERIEWALAGFDVHQALIDEIVRPSVEAILREQGTEVRQVDAARQTSPAPSTADDDAALLRAVAERHMQSEMSLLEGAQRLPEADQERLGDLYEGRKRELQEEVREPGWTRGLLDRHRTSVGTGLGTDTGGPSSVTRELDRDAGGNASAPGQRSVG
jgi:transposase